MSSDRIRPPTVGSFTWQGVPLVNYLTAPFYLFDAMDTLDKIHRPEPRADHARHDSHHRIHRRGVGRRHARPRGCQPAAAQSLKKRWKGAGSSRQSGSGREPRAGSTEL